MVQGDDDDYYNLFYASGNKKQYKAMEKILSKLGQ